MRMNKMCNTINNKGNIHMTQPPPQQPSPIRVKMKVGNVEFEIEGTVDQTNEAVGKLLSTVTEKLKETPLISEKESAPTRDTCKALIQKMWEEGWFSTARGLGDVHSELARKGFHYDRTAVAHALIDLVKDGVLAREGQPRRYQYLQKRPP